MHIESVLHQLRSLRLSDMANSLEERLKNGDHRDLSHEEFLAILVEDEYTSRQNRKLKRMLSRSGFKPEMACMENIHYNKSRGLEKSKLSPFTSTHWIEKGQNLILTGPTGTGKTFIAEAIGNRSCRNGFTSEKRRFRQLFDGIQNARGTGEYSRHMEKLDKIKVLILDDFVMSPITQTEQAELMDLIDQRDQRGSMIITSQYPIEKWYERLPDPTMSDAICDRLIHCSVKINLKGDSMRKKKINPD